MSTIDNKTILNILNEAIYAPSGHNSQPWLFKINNNEIHVYLNPNKLLPVVDPDNREAFISLGCLLENIIIVSSNQGLDCDFIIHDNEEDHIITVNLKSSDSKQYDYADLYPQIKQRQTNRSIYNNSIISDEDIKQLLSIHNDLESNVQIHLYQKNSQSFNTIIEYIIQGNNIQMYDKEFLQELKSYMRVNKQHKEATSDGLSYDVFGAPNFPTFLAKPIINLFVNAKSQNKGDRKKLSSSSHLLLFTTKLNSHKGWIELGRVLQKLTLKATILKIAHSYFNQPIEVAELNSKLSRDLNLIDEYPMILIRLGYAKESPYSIRRKPIFI